MGGSLWPPLFDEVLPCHDEQVKTMSVVPVQVTPQTLMRANLWQRQDLLL